MRRIRFSGSRALCRIAIGQRPRGTLQAGNATFDATAAERDQNEFRL
jgi:hypothetical protein